MLPVSASKAKAAAQMKTSNKVIRIFLIFPDMFTSLKLHVVIKGYKLTVCKVNTKS